MASPRREQKRTRAAQARAAQLAAKRRRNTLQAVVSAIVVAVIVGLVVGFTGIGSGGDGKTADSTTTTTAATGTVAQVNAVPAGQKITGDTPCPATDGSAARASSFEKAPSLCINPAKTYTADFDTNQGHIVASLDTAKTPNTTNNFVVLSRYKYYDGSAIFRIDPSIAIVQGGGPNTQSASDPGPGYTIADEGSGYTYKTGDLVMARTSQPNSASAQYFFATGDGVSTLDSQGTYVNFGHVTSGLDVLQKIAGLYVADDSGLGGGPKEPVIVNAITITES